MNTDIKSECLRQAVIVEQQGYLSPASKSSCALVLRAASERISRLEKMLELKQEVIEYYSPIKESNILKFPHV